MKTPGLSIAMLFCFWVLISSCNNQPDNKVETMKVETNAGTQTFFNEYASALLTYSGEKIAAFYMIPLTVYSDEGIQQVTEMKQVTAFWEQGVKPYKDQGIVKSVPQIIEEDQLSQTITTCEVLWKNYDAAGKETSSETNFYILNRTKDGLRICGLVIMNQ